MKIILFFLLACLTYGCMDTKPQQAVDFDKKMTETIAIHDEVMPEMSKINILISKLETNIDSTNTASHQQAIKDLKNGYDKMMNWMQSFGDEFSKKEINQGIQLKDIDSLNTRLKALDNAYKSAIDMKNHINKAITNAQKILP